MQSPKMGQMGKQGIDLLSSQESRNCQIRMDKPHQSTRNSQVVKMSSLFASNHEKQAVNEGGYWAGNKDESQKNHLNDYY